MLNELLAVPWKMFSYGKWDLCQMSKLITKCLPLHLLCLFHLFVPVNNKFVYNTKPLLFILYLYYNAFSTEKDALNLISNNIGTNVIYNIQK